MSRYVKKPHGLTIGSDNVFFYRDSNDKMRDFPCIVSVSQLYFENYSSLHAGILSSAEQLLFYPVKISTGWLGNFELTDTRHRLRNYWVDWLDANCPGWGYPPPKHSDRNPPIFFAKRKHALAFTQHVAALLKGEQYL